MNIKAGIVLLFPFLTYALDGCGPQNQPLDAPDTCYLGVTPGPNNGINSQQIPAPYGFVCDLDGSQKPLNPIDCEAVIFALCDQLADPAIQRDIWHWVEKGGCRIGMWLPGSPGSAPPPTIQKCRAQVFEPMVQACGAWGTPSRGAVTPPVNRGSVNINVTLGSGSGYPAIDRPYSIFATEQNGVAVDPGYPSYIIEAPANY